MNERRANEAAFYSLPDADWSVVDADLRAELAVLAREIERALAGAPDAPKPAALAFRLHEVAGRLIDAVAGEEQALRQVISTLRTALAVCWDLYSVQEAAQTTVAQHMQQLRESIEDFERSLRELRQRGSAPPDTG